MLALAPRYRRALGLLEESPEHAQDRPVMDVLYPRCEEGPTFERWELVE